MGPEGEPAEVSRRHVVLIGMMAAGKTTVGRRVAEQLDRPFHDSDVDLFDGYGQTGAAIASRHGVPYLHGLEAQVLLVRLRADEPAVIAAAASTVESAVCRGWLRQRAVVVWLSYPLSAFASRNAAATHRRRVRAGDLEELARRREPRLRAVADLVLDATADPDATAAAVVAHVRSPS